jgi:hypothetical protein
MPHPVYAAAAAVAPEYTYPADVVDAAATLYDATLDLLDRRPMFGDVAEALALGILSVVDYLGPDTVALTLYRRRETPAVALTRERFGR